ncbi:hypothetical protein [Tomitella biformata]|uniref:hypothetical protein n=1 Tax=Tomitella biformata TaxID=630403 RepID=UPI0011DD9120|nr:hypothetical protein [Tomitella biformata]
MAMDSEFQWIEHYAPAVAASIGRSYDETEVIDALTHLAPIVADMCGLAARDSDQLGTRVNLEAWAQAVTDHIDDRAEVGLSEAELDELPVDVDRSQFVYPGSDIDSAIDGGGSCLVAIPATLYGDTLAALVTGEQMLTSWQHPTLFEPVADSAEASGNRRHMPTSDVATLCHEMGAVRRRLHSARATTESTPANGWPVLTVAVSENVAAQAAAVLSQFGDSHVLDELEERQVITPLVKATVASACVSVSVVLSSTILGGSLQRVLAFDTAAT